MRIKRQHLSFIIFLLISVLYFIVILPSRSSIHENGHLFALRTMFPEYRCNIFDLEVTGSDSKQTMAKNVLTQCQDVDISKITLNQKLVILTSGYGTEFIFAFLLILIPFSIAGGIWMLNLAYYLLFVANQHQSDLAFMPFGVRVVLTVLLILLFGVSILIQKQYNNKLLSKKYDVPYKLQLAAVVLVAVIISVIILTKPESAKLPSFPDKPDKQEFTFIKCYYLPDYQQKYKCYASLFDNFHECQYFYEKIKGRYNIFPRFCDSVFAIKYNNYMKCENFSRYSVGSCLGEIASFKNNASICNSISELSTGNQTKNKEKTTCFITMVFNTGNYALCATLTGKDDIERCRVYAVIGKGDKKKCSEFKGYSYQFCMEKIETLEEYRATHQSAIDQLWLRPS